jgi:hypothetical protein
MEYPREFSRQARARVEAERLKARQEFEQDRISPVPSDWTTQRWDQCTLYTYILRVFLAFAQEACQLGRDGTFAVDQVREEVEGFLRAFGIEAYNERGRDRTGAKLPNILNRYNEDLRPDVYSEFRVTDEWRQFEEELLTVAESQGGRIAAKDARTFSTVRTLTEQQRWRLADADKALMTSLAAHEQMRSLLEHSGWRQGSVSGSRSLTMAEAARRLQVDLAKWAATTQRVLAEAAWPMNSVAPFQKRLEADARDILAQAFTRIQPQDRPLLDRDSLESALWAVVTEWMRKAERDFPPPWLANVPEQNPHERRRSENDGHLRPPIASEGREKTGTPIDLLQVPATMDEPAFQQGTKEYPQMFVQWDSFQKLWTLRDRHNDKQGRPGPDESVSTDSEAGRLFKQAARIAVSRLRHSKDAEVRRLAVTLRDPLYVWLDLMRTKERGFRRIPQLRSWRGGKSIEAFQRSGIVPSDARLTENGTIAHVFQESAAFWDDLAERGFDSAGATAEPTIAANQPQLVTDIAAESESRPESPTDGISEPWAADLDTPDGRKAAREGWKRHWSLTEHECTNDDLTQTAFSQKDRPFLNQWENGTARLKDPKRSVRIQGLERVLRRNIPPKWHPASKKV